MVLRWREVVKGEKREIKKTEDSPALVEVENFDFDTDHSECFLSQDINLGNISIKQDFLTTTKHRAGARWSNRRLARRARSDRVMCFHNPVQACL